MGVSVTRNDCFILDAVVRGLIDEIIYVRLHSEFEHDHHDRSSRHHGRSVMPAVRSGVMRIGAFGLVPVSVLLASPFFVSQASS